MKIYTIIVLGIILLPCKDKKPAPCQKFSIYCETNKDCQLIKIISLPKSFPRSALLFEGVYYVWQSSDNEIISVPFCSYFSTDTLAKDTLKFLDDLVMPTGAHKVFKRDTTTIDFTVGAIDYAIKCEIFLLGPNVVSYKKDTVPEGILCSKFYIKPLYQKI